MADTSAKRVQLEPQADVDPLDYWLAQERNPQVEDRFQDQAADADRSMPGGWWLLPVAVIAVPTWATLLWVLLR